MMIDTIVHDVVFKLFICHVLIQDCLDHINTMSQLFAPCPYLLTLNVGINTAIGTFNMIV